MKNNDILLYALWSSKLTYAKVGDAQNRPITKVGDAILAFFLVTFTWETWFLQLLVFLYDWLFWWIYIRLNPIMRLSNGSKCLRDCDTIGFFTQYDILHFCTELNLLLQWKLFPWNLDCGNEFYVHEYWGKRRSTAPHAQKISTQTTEAEK